MSYPITLSPCEYVSKMVSKIIALIIIGDKGIHVPVSVQVAEGYKNELLGKLRLWND